MGRRPQRSSCRFPEALLLGWAIGAAGCASTLAAGSQAELLLPYRGRELPAGELILSPLGQIAFDLPADRELSRLYLDTLGRRLPIELRNSSRFDEVRWAEATPAALVERSLALKGGRLLVALPKDGEAAVPGSAQRWVLFLGKVQVSLQGEHPRLLHQEVAWVLWDDLERRPAAYGRTRQEGTLDFDAKLFQVGEREREVEALITGLAVELFQGGPFFPSQRL